MKLSIINRLSSLPLANAEIIARAERVNTRIDEFLRTRETGLTPEQRFAIIIELIDNPGALINLLTVRAVTEVAGQEALSAQRQVFYDFYTKVATAPATSAIVAKMLPGPSAPEFTEQINHMTKLLTKISKVKSNTPSQKFRYEKAIEGLQYLATIRANFNNHGLPNIRQMFGLLYNLCEDQKNSYTVNYLAEHMDEFTKAFSGIDSILNDPIINQQVATYTDVKAKNLARINYLLTKDVGKQLMPFISGDIEQSPVALTHDSLRFIAQYGKQIAKDIYNPIIEAMLMSVRGHNVRLDNPMEPNKPACVDGVYLNLIKELSQIPDLSADGAASAISSVSVVACY